jgi:hypothetical protein
MDVTLPVGFHLNATVLENREYGRGDPLRWPRDTLYPQKLALTSPTGGDRSVSIVRFRTKATEFLSRFSKVHYCQFITNPTQGHASVRK